jgi:mono/diheme cytochrome c family protein/glucose/arabinose dehydrogenase
VKKKGEALMRHKLLALTGIALAALVGPAVVLGQTGVLSSIVDRPWPPPVKEDPPMPPVMEPADAIKTLHMPPGYQVQLVAAEPLIKDPILMEFDGDGRLWVVELPGWAYNDKIENSLEPVNDIVILEDTNNDGVFDKRTVFMDKLVLPRAIKILDKNCALVGEPPNLWKACDTNGDLKADTKELVDNGFSRLGVLEHGANGLFWGMDNVLRVSEHTYNVNYTNGKFTTTPTLNRGQWGVTQDDGGRIYRNVNTDPLFVDYVADRYYSRNPNLVRTNGLYQSLVEQEKTLIWPIHPTQGINRGYRKDIFREDGTSTYYGGVSSPMIYRGDALPKELYGQPFVVDGPTNIVHLLNLKNDSGKLAAEDYYKKGEFLASTDVRFRPVQVTTGPDGTIYVLDMYRGVSQDGPIQTDYLRDYILKRGLEKGINRGRLYRVVYKGAPPLNAPKPQMSKEAPAQLVAHLSKPNGWWRDTAQQLIIQRADKSVVPALTQLANSAPDPRTRIQALWTIEGLGAMTEPLVVKALSDASPDIRAAGLQLSERFLARPGATRNAVLAKMDDPNWFVRRQLAATLGELPADAKVEALANLLGKYGDDPITVDIAVSGLGGQERQMLTALLGRPSPPEDAIAMLAGAATRARDPATVQSLFALINEANRPTPVRLAVIKGITLGLTGPGRGPGNAVAGGRAGGGVPGVTVRRQATNLYELTSTPSELVRMSEGSGAGSDEAKTLIALLSWPGKPPPPAAPPLTAEEQKLFELGKGHYESTCAACHGPEGQGVDRVGAKLAGSAVVNSQNDAVTRVLINGKEGPVGLMPPLGAGMSDEDLAGVLTYIRRSFGNIATPIVPAAVKETRQAYSHRATPWTDAELASRRN